MGEVLTELPKYKSHKIVHAIKIENIDYNDKAGEKFTAILYPSAIPEYEQYDAIDVSSEFVLKHLKTLDDGKNIEFWSPDVPGYYVVYEDGYKSWSPVEAFEKGYTLMNDSDKPMLLRIESAQILEKHIHPKTKKMEGSVLITFKERGIISFKIDYDHYLKHIKIIEKGYLPIL